MFEIGILQGRLSPSREGKFQFYPSDWRAEFPIAKEMGFDCIEWLFDWPDFEKNAIWTRGVEETEIPINSLGGDYFMKYKVYESPDVLQKLVDLAKITKRKLLTIPLLEANAPKTDDEKQKIINALNQVTLGEVRIALETEMTVEELKDYCSDQIGVLYDIGNCTSYGFDCPEDLRKLKEKVFAVHLKDRKVGTTQSLMLGTGDAKFVECFQALSDIGYHGALIMQGWRGEDYLQDARNQLAFIRSQL